MKFLRNTHDADGVYRPLTTAQAMVWSMHGFVGHMLDSTKPMRLDDLLCAVSNYRFQFNEPCEMANEVAYHLVCLLDVNLARAVPDDE